MMEVRHELVGGSAAIRDTIEFIAKVAPKDVTVLVRGESGTGKELVARAIHRNSARAGGPFIALNCAAVPDELIESEFFGFEKGAFTGALGRKKGKIEAAHNGTLFLDEIGDMKASMQVKLLRVLQERELERVGGTTPIGVDIRVIAATNRDLEAAIAHGEFREDLYYRLKVLSVTIPPLRERRDDILPLALRFVTKYGARHRPDVLGISDQAQTLLHRYHWPGNVRQLENVMESAVVLGSAELVEARDLPADVVIEPPKTLAEAPIGLRKIRHQVERYAIENALIWANGSHKEAARLLDIHERSVSRCVERLRNDSQIP